MVPCCYRRGFSVGYRLVLVLVVDRRRSALWLVAGGCRFRLCCCSCSARHVVCWCGVAVVAEALFALVGLERCLWLLSQTLALWLVAGVVQVSVCCRSCSSLHVGVGAALLLLLGAVGLGWVRARAGGRVAGAGVVALVGRHEPPVCRRRRRPPGSFAAVAGVAVTARRAVDRCVDQMPCWCCTCRRCTGCSSLQLPSGWWCKRWPGTCRALCSALLSRRSSPLVLTAFEQLVSVLHVSTLLH